MTPTLAQIAKHFVHLHVHSYYSFFGSTLSPAEIVEWARSGQVTPPPPPPPESVGDVLVLERHASALSSDSPGKEAPSGDIVPAIALTDTNAMTGLVEFYELARAAGVKPLLGLELTQPYPHERELLREHGAAGMRLPSERDEEEEALAPMGRSTSPLLCPGDFSLRLVLLARDFKGYSRMCELATQRMLDPDFDLLPVAESLGPHVVAMSDSPQLLTRMAAEQRTGALRYGILVPLASRRQRNRAVYDTARQLGLPLVVTCDVRSAHAADLPLIRLLTAMQQLETLERLRNRPLPFPADGTLLSRDAVSAFFGITRGHALASELAQAMANTRVIAEACNCELPLGEWKFPRLTTTEEASAAELRQRAFEGLAHRYGPSPPAEARERLERELAIIQQLRFTDYFLMVHRIVEEAQRRGIRTLGRGSAANSIVTYVLGISHVCPIRNHLYFERFLNPERSAPPDIDLDFPWDRRDEILRWCFEFFGADHVALISTIQTLRMRQAVREVAKAHGLPESEIERFNRLKGVGYVLEERDAKGQVVRTNLSEGEPWRRILATAQRLTGFPRHLSVHCGGIVLAPCRISDYVALTRSAKGFVITQMDMNGVEALGLVKMDLLGNRSLAVLDDALDAAVANPRAALLMAAGTHATPIRSTSSPEEGRASPHTAERHARESERLAREAARMKLAGTRRGTSVALAGLMREFEKGEELPLPAPLPSSRFVLRKEIERLEFVSRDPATRALIHDGRTIGCFYIESPGMRALFERLRCEQFDEVVAASSIIRPGVAESGMMEAYIARHRLAKSHGKRSETARDAGGPHLPSNASSRVHALLLELLPETHGVMVYQEDVLRVAHEVAGMSYAQADLLRRAMSGKSRSAEAMARVREAFLEGAMRRHGLERSEAEELWRQVESFAGYSFCKGHSAAFAVLSYQVAYLKAHFPAEFFAAVLSNGGGFYGAGAYLEEARRWGLRTLPPSVNESAVEFTGRTRWVRGYRAGGWVRVGLGAIQRLGPACAEKIVQERARGGVFTSVRDFLRRVRPQPEQARALARAGALDCLAGARNAAESFPPLRRLALRRALLIELEELLSRLPYGLEELDLGGGTKPLGMPAPSVPYAAAPTPREALWQLCQWEWETLGFMVSGHPVDFVEVPRGAIAARDIRRYPGERVQMVGWAIAAKVLTARNSGKPMQMLTLEDRTDTFEAVLFPPVYARLAPRTVSCGPYRVVGKVDMRLGSPTLEVHDLELLPWSLPRAQRGE
ncbi:MAG: DNA polymerase III subunit alpha [Candidatus Hydrogenedentota bacterium]|nr:MAG: DNA polymerase III subunit alpha [Candidatus Hydrogenedentota bacterium]